MGYNSPFKKKANLSKSSKSHSIKSSFYDPHFEDLTDSSQKLNMSSSIFDSIDLNNFYDIISFPYKGSLESTEDSVDNLIIQIDYSNLKNLTEEEIIFLRVFIMPRALENIASLIRVKYRNNLFLKKSKIKNCNDEFVTVPDYYYNRDLEVDLLVFVNSVQLGEDTFAMTSSCVSSEDLGRTIAANLIYNNIFLDLNKQGIEDAVETVQHEMIHAFVFDSAMFKRLPKNSEGLPSTFIDENGRRFLAGDEILKQAQEYFQCKFRFYLIFRLLN